jgi:sugar/nucleoside kinase (ribokinase family)
MVIINEEGERSFVCNPGNFIRVNINDYDWDLLTDYDVLLVGSCFILDGLLPDLPQVLQKCREHNVTSIVDTVWPTRPNSQLIIPSLPYMDFFTPSFEEAQLISGRTTVEDIADWCLQQGCKNVIIKMDKNGCYLANDSVRMHIPALKVLLEDSTGAGDCFLAGFIKGLERGYDIVKSTQLANSAGAMCVQKLGAYTGITNFNDLEERYFVQYDNIAV